jgi:hypothetical protein
MHIRWNLPVSSESRVASQRPVRSDNHLSEAAVRRVLERAVEIDALQSARMTPEELREVALEAGISPQAVEQALAEVRQMDASFERRSKIPTPEAASPWLNGVLGMVRTAVIGVGGFGLGVIARALFGATGADLNVEQFLAVITLTFASTEFAFQHSGGGSHAGFQRDNAMLWGSFTAGWSAVHGYFWDDLVSATVILWLACGFAGASVIAWKQKRSA